MIKRLNLFSNNAQTELIQALVDKSHQKLKLAYLRKIYRNIGSEKYLTNLLSALRKNFKSSSYTLRIKSLIVLHYLIKKTEFQNQRIILFTENQLEQMKEKKSPSKEQASSKAKNKVLLQNQQKQYIQKNIVQFYIMYLMKYMMHSKAYISAKKAVESPKQYMGIIKDCSLTKTQDTTCATKVQNSLTKFSVDSKALISHINNGFEILNLVNFIIQSQESFNKMGRYYIEHEQILNLFIMYLDDLTIYNDYTKKLAKLLTKTVNHVQEEEIKHCFLYLTESQKTSDRLYEFYYNRYFYSKVKRLITMPTFLTIDNDDFQRVIKEIKKVDKELLTVVKESKYSQEYKLNKTYQGCITEPSLTSHDDRKGKSNRTMMAQTGHKKMYAINRTLQDLRDDRAFSKRDAQQNISRYIQTIEDIFQDDDEKGTDQTTTDV